MTHDQLAELMSAYLDGEVDAREKALAEAALRTDPAAQRLLDELRHTVAVVGGLPRYAAPSALAADLDAQLERTEILSSFRVDAHHSALRKAPWRASLRAAAMLALVLGAGWWFLSRQQEKRPDSLALAPKPAEKLIEGPATTLNRPTKPAPGIPADTLLASGADPVVLVGNSFEPEPIRLRVMARDAKERDTLKKEFVNQLAQANTENLARRGASSEKKGEVGSFYFEGKPGVNFANAQDRQVLVRMPQASVESMVDDVAAGAKIRSEQVELQVGAAVVRGRDNAQNILHTLTQKDQPKSVAAEAARQQPPPASLMDTLGEIVGLGSVAKMSAPSPEERLASTSRRDAMAGARTASASDKTPTADKALAEAEKNESAPEVEGVAHRSLVSKKWEAARSKQLDASTGDAAAEGLRETTTLGPPARAPSGPAERFITMVVEFVIPEPKPPAAKEAGR